MAERLGDPLRFAGWSVPLLALESILVVWLKAWGDHLTAGTYIRFWCVLFSVQLAPFVVFGLFTPRRDRALSLGLVGGLLVVFIWLWGLPLLISSGLVDTRPIATRVIS
jgi:hypothetical protein